MLKEWDNYNELILFLFSISVIVGLKNLERDTLWTCLLYTSDAADE